MPVAGDKPAVDAILLKVMEAVPFQLTTDGGVEEVRQRFRDVPRAEVHPGVRSEDRVIDGPGGPIPIRVYRPAAESDAPLPVVVFIHGGGWSVGDLDTYDGFARRHVVGADAIVVKIEYRLAPEHPYPAAVDDAWAATQWVAEHAANLGADRDRLVVAGDSAGGNLAAVVSQLARDAEGHEFCFSCCGIRRRPSIRRCPRSRRMRIRQAAGTFGPSAVRRRAANLHRAELRPDGDGAHDGGHEPTLHIEVSLKHPMVELEATLTLRPKDGLHVIAKRRQEAP